MQKRSVGAVLILMTFLLVDASTAATDDEKHCLLSSTQAQVVLRNVRAAVQDHSDRSWTYAIHSPLAAGETLPHDGVGCFVLAVPAKTPYGEGHTKGDVKDGLVRIYINMQTLKVERWFHVPV